MTFSDAERPIIELSGFEQTRTDDQLDVTLVWRALVDQPVDYVRFVHLLDAATGEILAQIDSFPDGNSYPPGQWQPGEVVVDQVKLDVGGLEPGAYRVATGFYLPVEPFPLLEAADEDGALPDGRVVLP